MNRFQTTGKRSVWFRYGLLAVVAAMAIAPVAAYAADAFDDVPDTNIFHDDIAWMADNGITAGCGGNSFCPKQTVTREQMSAFMKRLAVNKVVDAATALEADHATTADSATTADDADTVEGYDAAGLLPRFLRIDDFELGPVASGSEVCITDAYTPAVAEVAVIDARVSANGDGGPSTLWLRTAFSTDAGGTFTDTDPGRTSPEQTVDVATDGALAYVDVMELTPGTPYNFGVEINGGSKTNVICQLLVTIHGVGPSGTPISTTATAAGVASQTLDNE